MNRVIQQPTNQTPMYIAGPIGELGAVNSYILLSPQLRLYPPDYIYQLYRLYKLYKLIYLFNDNKPNYHRHHHRSFPLTSAQSQSSIHSVGRYIGLLRELCDDQVESRKRHLPAAFPLPGPRPDLTEDNSSVNHDEIRVRPTWQLIACRGESGDGRNTLANTSLHGRVQNDGRHPSTVYLISALSCSRLREALVVRARLVYSRLAVPSQVEGVDRSTALIVSR